MKEIRVRSVLQLMALAASAKAHAIYNFANSEGSYSNGLYEGIDLGLKLLLTDEELVSYARENGERIQSMVLTKEEADKRAITARADLAREAADAIDRLKGAVVAEKTQSMLAKALTEALKGWPDK